MLLNFESEDLLNSIKKHEIRTSILRKDQKIREEIEPIKDKLEISIKRSHEKIIKLKDQLEQDAEANFKSFSEKHDITIDKKISSASQW